MGLNKCKLFDRAFQKVMYVGLAMMHWREPEKIMGAGSLKTVAAKLGELERSLNNLSPHELARRGYSLVLHSGRPLVTAADVRENDEIVVQLLDGDVRGTVRSVAFRR